MGQIVFIAGVSHVSRHHTVEIGLAGIIHPIKRLGIVGIDLFHPGKQGLAVGQRHHLLVISGIKTVGLDKIKAVLLEIFQVIGGHAFDDLRFFHYQRLPDLKQRHNTVQLQILQKSGQLGQIEGRHLQRLGLQVHRHFPADLGQVIGKVGRLFTGL